LSPRAAVSEHLRGGHGTTVAPHGVVMVRITPAVTQKESSHEHHEHP
jgi:hypothetical protein